MISGLKMGNPSEETFGKQAPSPEISDGNWEDSKGTPVLYPKNQIA